MEPKIYIGCSGWSYEHWIGKFYPPDLKKQNKNKEGEEAEQAQVTVYHIAIPHQEELWREWMPEIEKFMPKVRILFLEFTTLLDKGERKRIEKHFNFLSQGKVLPYFHSEDFSEE
jgi:uncharacterized protein YecE (DUF72 family)